MPFNGAGTFNRLYSWQTDAANGIKIRADRMDAETNGIATGLSTCVTRDGQSPATANLPMGGFRHTNVGAAQNPTDYATAGQVVNSGLTYATGVGGTSNAVTLTTTVAPTALAAGQQVMFKATSDVAAGGVTVNRSVLGAKAVQQFGAALPAGAWLNGDIVILAYDGTQYQLVWPLRTVGLLNSINTWTATQIIANSAPAQWFKETDQVLPAGLFAWTASGGAFALKRNTAVAGDFSTSTTPLSVSAGDIFTFLQPPVMSGASITNLPAANLTGTLPNGVFPSTLPAVSGVNLTALNASNLGSGTVPDARFPATLPAVSGANLTALNATQLTSGTVPDARFPATLPAVSGANLTSLNASNLSSGTVPAARLPNPAAATLGGVKSLAAVAHKFLTSIGTDGLPVAAQPVVADLSDAGTAATVNTGTSGATLGLLNANKTDSGNNTYSGTSAFTGQATFSKQANGPEAALADGASIAWDLSTAQAAHVTLGGNRTLANPTNMVAGGSYALKITQDGTGTRTLAYGSAYKWAGGAAPVLSTTAGAVDIITFYSDGVSMFGAILKAFA